MSDDKPEVVILPNGMDATEYLAGLRREKADQESTGGDPDRVKSIDAEIASVGRQVRGRKADEAATVTDGESTAAASREKAVHTRRSTR